jgi:DNA processing protein
VSERQRASGALPAEAYAVALTMLPAAGPARLAALVAAGGPAEAWRAVCAGRLPAVVADRVGPAARALAVSWQRAAREIDPGAALAAHRQRGVGICALGSAGYPARLRDDPHPPAVLFSQGDLAALARPTVAIVGTRRCTTGGAGVALELGRDLAAAGVCVVSGLALGIDGAAHRGALAAAGAAPVGVVGCGLDVVYPRRHADLWHEVARAGALVGESPLGAPPEPWRFPARNRIIAGLADLVVVVESPRAGGSMLTVDQADARGVDVMAVPGSVRSAAAAGCNDLLAEGRAPVRDVDDVLVALGLSRCTSRAVTETRPLPMPDDQRVLDSFEWQPVTVEHVAARTGMPLPAIGLALARLVDDGWVAARGGWYERLATAAR